MIEFAEIIGWAAALIVGMGIGSLITEHAYRKEIRQLRDQCNLIWRA